MFDSRKGDPLVEKAKMCECACHRGAVVGHVVACCDAPVRLLRHRLTNLIWRRDFIVAAAAGVVTATYVVALSQLFPMGGPDPPLVPLFAWSFVAMIVCGFVIGLWGHWGAVMLFAASGIFAGVVTNSVYDSLAHGIDHNLFPIEIAFVGVLLVPGMAVGVALARVLRWLTARSNRKSEG